MHSQGGASSGRKGRDDAGACAGLAPWHAGEVAVGADVAWGDIGAGEETGVCSMPFGGGQERMAAVSPTWVSPDTEITEETRWNLGSSPSD